MKTITIRELHSETGKWVREAARHGEVFVTDRGQTVAKIVPESQRVAIPFFARRKLSPEFEKLSKNGKLRGKTDITQYISDDRDDRYQ